MTEKEMEFWTELRFSITRSEVFEAYCDWIEPRSYILASPFASIEGRVGFLTPEMEVYQFALSIPNHHKHISQTDWKKLLPITLDHSGILLTGNTIRITLVEPELL